MNILLYNYLPSLLIVLIPVLSLTGPFLPDFSLFIISIIFLYFIFKEKKWFYFNNKLVLFIYLFYLYIFLYSLYLKFFHNIDFDSQIFFFRFIIYFIAVGFWISQFKNLLKYLCISTLVALIFCILDGYYQYFTGFNFFGIEKNGDRLGGIF